MSYPRYPAYTDSGVAWLGEVPAGWAVKRLKYVVSCNDDVLPETTPADHPLNYVEISDVSEVEGIIGSQPLTFGQAPSRARRLVQAGDTIISTVRTYLKAIAYIAVPLDNMVVSTGFAVLRPRAAIVPAFLGYVARSPYFLEVVVARSVGISYPAVNASDLVDIPMLLPPLAEQRAIAAFLDGEVARIDALIARQTALLALLAEQRQALIGAAVTRGLDPAAPRKDSGVAWLGHVPAHWTVQRLKHVTSFVTSGSRGWAQHYSDDGALFLRIGNLTRDSIRLDLSDVQHVRPPNDREGQRTRVQQNDLLISITADIGSIAVLNEDIGEAYINQHIALVRPMTDCIEASWIGYSLRAESGQIQFQTLLTGGIKDGLGLDDVRNLLTLVPPLPEQRAIAAYLDAETARLDALVVKATQAVALLREHRSALISAAVTGQIDVRAVVGAAREPPQ